jgi:uncharacterized membrane protein YfcA
MHGLLVLAVWLIWLGFMHSGDRWVLFVDNWFMSATMALGSFIAGATSEGGGAVAFPVMTLVFDIEPHVARDFSLMIQSVGMTAAALVITLLRIPVEWRAIHYAGSGGILGIITGLEVVSPLLSPALTKMFFVSVWLSFAAALYWINRDRAREVLTAINGFKNHHKALLLLAGVAGGTVSGVTGSGLDIITFALLVLAFNVCEKVATPTSVILMAINSLTGFFWKETFGSGMAPEAWSYWYVCIPVVVVGAPLGARFIRDKSRLFVAGFLYISIGVQYAAALLIVPQSATTLLFSSTVVLLGTLCFWQLGRYGRRHVAGLPPG